MPHVGSACAQCRRANVAYSVAFSSQCARLTVTCDMAPSCRWFSVAGWVGWGAAVVVSGGGGGLDLVRAVRVFEDVGVPAGCFFGVVAGFAQSLGLVEAGGSA